MLINELLTDSILNQFNTNNRLNLFYKNIDFQNHFLEETKNVIQNYRKELLQIEQENQSEKWIGLMSEKALEIFCQNNQYIDTRKENISELQDIYRILWEEIVEEIKSEEVNFDLLQKAHLDRLTNWLSKTNSFVKDMNDPTSPLSLEVTCSEYSVDFQLKLLNIDIDTLIEPVLDIGCGKSANLVMHLRSKGIEAYGMDRLCNGGNELYFKVDWLDFEFQPQAWGTIISNLSFALHFTNHHYRKDGEYILYARKYMEILNSLKVPGTFYYAPGLPFIEAYLPKDRYKAFTYRISEDFSYTKVSTI